MDGAASLPAAADLRVEGLTVFVRGLEIQAGIGVYDHEHGRLQPLIIDVTLELAPAVKQQRVMLGLVGFTLFFCGPRRKTV